MENHIVLDILVIYSVAILSVILFRQLKQSSIVGYLVGGIIVGPSVFNLVSNVHEIEMLAEYGVVFFLFLVGLEFPLDQLSRMKKDIFGIGGLQVVLTSVLFSFLLKLYGLPTETAVLLGVILSLSSTAIVLKMLEEKGTLSSLNGKTSLSILLFQDLMIVPIMLMIPMLSGKFEGSLAVEVSLTFLKAGLLIGFLFLIARYVLRPVSRFIAIQKSRELFVITFLFIAIGTAILTEVAGFSMLLGAFLAGLLLSDTEYKHQIAAEFLPIRDSLLPIFFVSVGMLVDVAFFLENLIPILAVAAVIMTLKFLVTVGILRFSSCSIRHALISSFCLAQVGEFAFVLLLEGKIAGIFNEDLYQLALSSIVLSMLATPFIINRSNSLSLRLGGVPFMQRLFPAKEKEGDYEVAANLEDHVIVSGYGVTGKNLVSSLQAFDIPYVVVEVNVYTVEKAQKEGINIVFGDTERAEILKAVHIDKARAAVLTSKDVDTNIGTLRTIREMSPDVFTLVRTSYVQNFQDLKKAGANIVVLEEFQSSLLFVRELLGKFDFGPGEIQMLLDDIRINHDEFLKK